MSHRNEFKTQIIHLVPQLHWNLMRDLEPDTACLTNGDSEIIALYQFLNLFLTCQFELIINSQEFAGIIQERSRVHFTSFLQWLHLILPQYNIKAQNKIWYYMSRVLYHLIHCVDSCKPHSNHNTELLHHHKDAPMPPLESCHCAHHPQCQATTNPFSISTVLSFQEYYMI